MNVMIKLEKVREKSRYSCKGCLFYKKPRCMVSSKTWFNNECDGEGIVYKIKEVR
jgi:hypothetical protein